MHQGKADSRKILFRRLSACALAVFLLSGGGFARADEAFPTPLPENITAADQLEIDDRFEELNLYTVTFRNTRAYTPEVFNPGKVTESDYIRSESGSGDDWYHYRYEDDSELTIPGNTELIYGNRNYERYSQLLTYLDNAGITAEERENGPYSLQDALERSHSLFDRLHIGNLVMDRAVALPSSRIRTLTDDMKRFYSGAQKLYCFDSFPDEIGAWYLTFRQELSGIRSAGVPQVRIVLTGEGTALLELNRIIDHVNDDYELTAGATWQDAIRLFTETHGQKSFESELYSESFEISRINIAYDYELTHDDFTSLDAKIFPCWQIEGSQAITLAEGTGIYSPGTKIIPFSEIYSIPDGKKNINW